MSILFFVSPGAKDALGLVREATPEDLVKACESAGLTVSADIVPGEREVLLTRAEAAERLATTATNIVEAVRVELGGADNVVTATRELVGERAIIRGERDTAIGRAALAERDTTVLSLNVGRLTRERDDERGRAEKSESDFAKLRTEARDLRGRLHALVNTCKGLEERNKDLSQTRDALTDSVCDLRARLARFRAPVEGEPSEDDLCAAYEEAVRDAPAAHSRTLDGWRGVYRLGVQHERARHQPTEPRATEEELERIYVDAYDRAFTTNQDADKSARLAVATRVRAEYEKALP